MSKIKFCDSTLCDGAASLVGGGLKNEMILPLLDLLDDRGLSAVEAWGGSTFESCISAVYEDPWERLRLIRNHLKKTPLQIAFYGQNALGRRNFPDDTVEYFVRKVIDTGVDIIRATDPLNDLRNLEATLHAASRTNTKVITGIAYAPGPASNNDVFVLYAKQLEEMGAYAISIQDDAGSLSPYDAYQLIKALKGALSPATPIYLHTHCCTGMGIATALKAAEAGIDGIDTALSPFAGGPSLPSLEAMIEMLNKTPYSSDLIVDAFRAATLKAAGIRSLVDRTASSAFFPDVRNRTAQIPGGSLLSLSESLRDAKIENRREDVLKEIAQIREEAGHLPLLPPVSDIIIAQAILNTLSDRRYEMLSREFKALIGGEYGRTPSDVSPAFRNMITGSIELPDYRPADHMEPMVEKLREAVAPYMEQDEDLLTYAMFGQKALSFFEARKIQKYSLDPDADFQNKLHNA